MADKTKDVVGAGVIGAAIGAAAGVAVTKIMSDPEMKSKAAGALHSAKKYALDGVKQLKNKANELQEKSDEIAQDAKRMGKLTSKNARTL